MDNAVLLPSEIRAHGILRIPGTSELASFDQGLFIKILNTDMGDVKGWDQIEGADRDGFILVRNVRFEVREFVVDLDTEIYDPLVIDPGIREFVLLIRAGEDRILKYLLRVEGEHYSSLAYQQADPNAPQEAPQQMPAPGQEFGQPQAGQAWTPEQPEEPAQQEPVQQEAAQEDNADIFREGQDEGQFDEPAPFDDEEEPAPPKKRSLPFALNINLDPRVVRIAIFVTGSLVALAIFAAILTFVFNLISDALNEEGGEFSIQSAEHCALTAEDSDASILKACVQQNIDDDTMVNLAHEAFEQDRCDLGLRILISKGRSGVGEASMYLARAYDETSYVTIECVDKSNADAIYWYKKAQMTDSHKEEATEALEKLSK